MSAMLFLVAEVGAVAVSAVRTPGASAAPAPPGQGFTVTPGDLHFILKQIQIAEHHAATQTPGNLCGTLVGAGANQIPDRLTSYGLRTVDGSCNNLFESKIADDPSPTRVHFGAADQVFPRLTNPKFRDAEGAPPNFFGPPPAPPAPTASSYADKNKNVFDSQPRTISNLIVDQTSTNPAAIAAAEFPVRTQGNPGLHPCTTDPDPLASPPVVGAPADCVPSHKTLFIPNVTTDVGLSPPYNSLFTFFGQFFDHGVDQTVKSGKAVFVPLHADDPLVTLGPDGKPNTGDEVTKPEEQFMVLTRAQNQPGPDNILGTADDIQDATNTDSPWVDQSQTYTSHPSHQVFVREYVNDTTSGKPVATGKLLGGLAAGGTYPNSPDGRTGMATWASLKDQAEHVLGLKLVDRDVTNVPMLAVDPYGKFIPGPDRGLPQYVTKGPDAKAGTTDDVLVEGDTAHPVPVPNDVVYFDTPFVADIAHNADPTPVDTDHNPSTPAVAPTPDADDVPSADFAHQPAGTYDDEMLNAHFTAGDGRVNENIALTTIHQIFHSEHDRLVDDIKNTLEHNTAVTATDLAAWQKVDTAADGGYNYGERLFQAARFVTEMEYQHLVFEEFARKVQPGIRPFHVYSPDMNPAIPAEFAHAVYRFGHSMLDDTVARTEVDPTTGAKADNSTSLLNAFLNPPEYFHGASGTLTPEQAAGSVVMGSSDQVGNELDEFVTETLRNNLLGLPLDLPTINMARAREAGVPPLNDVRRQIFGQTNDGQMAPYTDWSDFGQHLKHPESLINYVAAYGTHSSITGATTLAAKRAAAKAIVDPSSPPATNPADIPGDAAAFMFSTADPGPDGIAGNADDGKDYSNVGGKTVTGVDDVDLWVGGLGEVTNLGGGLLGSTFNYVFQNTLEKLQDGDRLYYLNRTPGMNLRTQLEGNSFAEMIQRNTDGSTNTLKADAFATADCKFQLGSITFPFSGTNTVNADGKPVVSGAGSVNDDPNTECDENQLLLRKPDGTIQYRLINKVDPSGINGQSVYKGTADINRIFGGNDNDTFWGDDGNDIIEGNNGDDVALGGDGNDILTDLNGADTQKGGPGDDAIDGGPGDDIPMGGDGHDFILGGANDNESFAGEGNDFINAGQGADAVFGDGGDDWIQGGSGQDLLQGDHSAPFFDDPAETRPGNEVFVGQVGENDYDAEGGDDLMAQNAAVDRNAGAGGFDWAFHQYDTVGGDDDMAINNNLLGSPLPVVVNRDRWQETEADSGSKFNDIIRGDDNVPSTLGGAGFTGCDALDPAGVARIKGLDALVTTFPTPLSTVETNSATGVCPLDGDSPVPITNPRGNVWGEGNILLGGLGSDTITGRGADDIIDGDRALGVKISVRTDRANPASEIGTTDLMEGKALTGTFGLGTDGMTLQQAVFAGKLTAGNLVISREITGTELAPPASDCGATTPVNCDTAVFLGPRSSYTITPGTGGKITVEQTGPLGAAVGTTIPAQKVLDGKDTLTNIEQLKFQDQTVVLGPPSAPSGVSATAASGQATVSWTGAASDGGSPITSQEIVVSSGGSVVKTVPVSSGTATSSVVTGLTNGTSYTFQVRAVNAFGSGPLSAASAAVTPGGPLTAPTSLVGIRGATGGSVSLSWNAATGGTKPITGYQIQVRIIGIVVRTDTVAGTATTRNVTGLINGISYTFRVRAVTAATLTGTIPAADLGPLSVASNAVTPATVPGAPGILAPTAGVAGGAVTATANWSAPGNNGGSVITNYRVTAIRMAADGVTAVGTPTVALAAPAARTLAVTVPVAGNYRFQVVAINAVGDSPASARSALVAAR